MGDRPKSQARAAAEEEWERVRSPAPADHENRPGTLDLRDLLDDLDELVSELQSAVSRYERTSRERPQEREANRQALAPHMAHLCGKSTTMLGQVRPLVDMVIRATLYENQDSEEVTEA
jgi:hypothetical protein